VHLYECIWIEQTLDSFAGRLRLMIVAARTDTLVLRQLSFGHDLSAPWAFLKNAARHFALFAGLGLDCWFLKNRHGIMRVLRWPHEPIWPRRVSILERIRST